MNDLHKHFTAKVLRKNFTDTERLLWKYLRAKQMQGCKFRRQDIRSNTELFESPSPDPFPQGRGNYGECLPSKEGKLWFQQKSLKNQKLRVR